MNMDFSSIVHVVHNVGDETIIFENQHPDRVTQPLHWQRIVCKPDRMVVRPHGYYSGSVPSGGLVKFTSYFGRDAHTLCKIKRKFVDFWPRLKD